MAAACLVLCTAPASAQRACIETDAPTTGELIELASCFQATGQAVQALDVLDTAAGQAEDAAALVAIYVRQGQVLSSLGQYRDALRSLSAGMELAPDAPAEQVAALLNELGGAYMATGEPLSGLAAFADSYRMATAASLHGVTSGINLVRALAETSPAADYLERLDGLRVGALALPSSTGKAAALLGLAALYRELGPDPRAEDEYQVRAFELASAALELSNELDDARLVSFAYGELGEWYAAHRRNERALSFARQATLTAQRSGLSDAAYRWEWLSGRVLRALGRDADALTAYRAAIQTLSASQSALVTSERGFRDDILPLYSQYSDLMLARSADLSGSARRDVLVEVQVTLEGLRLAEVLNYFENQCVVPEVYGLEAGQSDAAVVIYPVLFDDRAELLVRAGGDLYQVTVDVGLAELTATVRALRDAIEDSSSGSAYLEPARRVYGWLIEPLMPVIEAAEPEALIIVPDGPLRTIPLGVLHDGSRFLVERYALGTTPGLSLVEDAAAAPPNRVLASGIVEAVQGFAPLPFVAEELATIAEQYPAEVYVDDAFLSATLQREVLEGGYAIVHMATHAQFQSDYERSFLLSYDDLITMDELEDMVGSQRFSDRPVSRR